MKYKKMNLQTPLCGLAVRHPIDDRGTVVLENLTDDSLTNKSKSDSLRSLLHELKEVGVRNIILDFSQFSPESKITRLLHLYGAVTIHDFQSRYIGITADEAVGAGPDFREYIAENLEAAVHSLRD